MIVLIPVAALLLALFAGYVAIHTNKTYALRYVLIAAATAFGLAFYYLFPALLGRAAPRYPSGDFHMIAMIEEPGDQVEMWVATADGTRLYRFPTPAPVRKQLRAMTDGHGQGIYALTGRFAQPGMFAPRSAAPTLSVRKPDLRRLPDKDVR